MFSLTFHVVDEIRYLLRCVQALAEISHVCKLVCAPEGLTFHVSTPRPPKYSSSVLLFRHERFSDTYTRDNRYTYVFQEASSIVINLEHLRQVLHGACKRRNRVQLECVPFRTSTADKARLQCKEIRVDDGSVDTLYIESMEDVPVTFYEVPDVSSLSGGVGAVVPDQVLQTVINMQCAASGGRVWESSIRYTAPAEGGPSLSFLVRGLSSSEQTVTLRSGRRNPLFLKHRMPAASFETKYLLTTLCTCMNHLQGGDVQMGLTKDSILLQSDPRPHVSCRTFMICSDGIRPEMFGE
jgi:hypothetical protein